MRIQKLKKDSERLFKLVIKTPENQIDYDYFSLISDYIDWIENNKFLKKTLYSTKSFEKYQPKALLSNLRSFITQKVLTFSAPQ